MDNIVKSKWQVRVAALVIFLLGFAAGALALTVYHSWSRAAVRDSGRDRFGQMLDRLHLDAEQRTQVQQILGDTRRQLKELRRESEPRVKEIQHQADERLRQVLTPEQWQQFQQMKDEMRGPRRRGKGDKGGPGQPRER